MTDPVHLDVIGVSVAAVPVVTRDDLGLDRFEDLGETTSRFVDVGSHERSGFVVLRPTGHSTVVIAQPVNVGDAEHSSRLLGLGPTAIDERLTRREIRRNLTVSTIGRDDEHHTVTLAHRPRDGSTRRDRLVVGVCVQADEGAHASTTAPEAISRSISDDAKPQSARISRECCPG